MIAGRTKLRARSVRRIRNSFLMPYASSMPHQAVQPCCDHVSHLLQKLSIAALSRCSAVKVTCFTHPQYKSCQAERARSLRTAFNSECTSKLIFSPTCSAVRTTLLDTLAFWIQRGWHVVVYVGPAKCMRHGNAHPQLRRAISRCFHHTAKISYPLT